MQVGDLLSALKWVSDNHQAVSSFDRCPHTLLILHQDCNHQQAACLSPPSDVVEEDFGEDAANSAPVTAPAYQRNDYGP